MSTTESRGSNARRGGGATRLLGGFEALAGRTTRHATALRVLATAATFSDVGLTLYGLGVGLVETNPLAAHLIGGAGPVTAMAALKGGALCVGVVAWVAMRADRRGLVPFGLALPWTGATLSRVVVRRLATILPTTWGTPRRYL